jgi:hypothetical protein
MSSTVAFITGVMFVLLVYALFSMANLESDELVFEGEENGIGLSNRKYELSCQTCRKLKAHIEVEPRVFECCKCHRRTYL